MASGSVGRAAPAGEPAGEAQPASGAAVRHNKMMARRVAPGRLGMVGIRGKIAFS